MVTVIQSLKMTIDGVEIVQYVANMNNSHQHHIIIGFISNIIGPIDGEDDSDEENFQLYSYRIQIHTTNSRK